MNGTFDFNTFNIYCLILLLIFQQCQTELPIKPGTDQELDEIHHKLLLEFKKKKDSAVERWTKRKNLMDVKTKRLEMMQQQYKELADKHHELEYKNGVAIIDGITLKKLSHEVNYAFLILLFKDKSL